MHLNLPLFLQHRSLVIEIHFSYWLHDCTENARAHEDEEITHSLVAVRARDTWVGAEFDAPCEEQQVGPDRGPQSLKCLAARETFKTWEAYVILNKPRTDQRRCVSV